MRSDAVVEDEIISKSQSLEQAPTDESRAVSYMGAVKERIDAIALPEELLSQKAMIEDIYVRLGNYQKEMKDLPSLKERYVISRAESENLLLELIGL